MYILENFYTEFPIKVFLVIRETESVYSVNTYQREIVTQLVELRIREVLGLIPWPTIPTEVFQGFFSVTSCTFENMPWKTPSRISSPNLSLS